MPKRKPVGWRGDSGRHGLAAKGINTGRKVKSAKTGRKVETRDVVRQITPAEERVQALHVERDELEKLLDDNSEEMVEAQRAIPS